MIHQDQPNGAVAAATTTNGTSATAPSTTATTTTPSSSHHPVPFIPQTFTNNDSDASARSLILALRPDWSSPDSSIEFVRFTDGITNTLLKAVHRRPGLSKDDVDREAILLRAYGNGTDLIIDRARETQNHELLMQHGLAPELLARFENGMMYRFIRGTVTHPEGLRRRDVYLAVARRLAQWHATVPCLPGKTHLSEKMNGHAADVLKCVDAGSRTFETLQEAVDGACPGKRAPNIWTVMQKWIFALPTDTQAQKERQALLQRELARLVAELSPRPGLGSDGLVFAHCDLLCGNVIVLPKGEATSLPDIPAPVSTTSNADDESVSVTFIDYEYAVPSPAAFDLANHFAEWGGFDCDFSVLPTRSQRREFVAEYVRSYFALAGGAYDHDAEVQRLTAEVDVYRGVPGFYWGIWSLIQATISQIDFDYASYAEVRLGEYWAWRAEVDGTRLAKGENMPLREMRWAEE
ncbi:kinase-like protein [Cryphonectria parasitica EP155]|uniref:ethanolamine kinase n=1 Tax=Cryphonectria parasitica (strain ATCC 38755 / EP155) TaxID=660469 RepID=A0A9P4XWL3_CRYP1|nr:kinase-like protein [Cryphonectria parasitica EP155]KAF3762284.1 kinase-like protein [Cryphonectria parasitica EP155]